MAPACGIHGYDAPRHLPRLNKSAHCLQARIDDKRLVTLSSEDSSETVHAPVPVHLLPWQLVDLIAATPHDVDSYQDRIGARDELGIHWIYGAAENADLVGDSRNGAEV